MCVGGWGGVGGNDEVCVIVGGGVWGHDVQWMTENDPTRSTTPPSTFPPHSFTASFPVFIKLLKELREMGFGVLSAQFGKHEWSLNTQLTWSTSAILNADDEIIEKYITDGWYVSNVLIALRRTDA